MADYIEPKSKRQFEGMLPEKRRAIASKGCKSVPKEKQSFATNATRASSAGRKGGRAVDPQNRAFSKDAALALCRWPKGWRG